MENSELNDLRQTLNDAFSKLAYATLDRFHETLRQIAGNLSTQIPKASEASSEIVLFEIETEELNRLVQNAPDAAKKALPILIDSYTQRSKKIDLTEPAVLKAKCQLELRTVGLEKALFKLNHEVDNTKLLQIKSKEAKWSGLSKECDQLLGSVRTIETLKAQLKNLLNEK